MKDGCQIIRSGHDIVMLVPLCNNLRPYSLTGPKALDPNNCIGRAKDWLSEMVGPAKRSVWP